MDFQVLALRYKKALSDLETAKREENKKTIEFSAAEGSLRKNNVIEAWQLDKLQDRYDQLDIAEQERKKVETEVEKFKQLLIKRLGLMPDRVIAFNHNYPHKVWLNQAGELETEF